jgi:hypothetical protein
VRRILKLLIAVASGGALLTFLLASNAFAAGSIDQINGSSTGSPSTAFAWPGDGSGNPVFADVHFTGFVQGNSVFLEECDGVPFTDPNWDPTIDCINTTSPAAVVADANGQGTFLHTDPNHHFKPVKGNVGGSFWCLGNNDPDPADAQGEPIYRNCQLRISTNNGGVTTDQGSQLIQLPDTTGGGQVPEVPYAVILPLGAIVLGGGFLFFRHRRSQAAA